MSIVDICLSSLFCLGSGPLRCGRRPPPQCPTESTRYSCSPWWRIGVKFWKGECVGRGNAHRTFAKSGEGRRRSSYPSRKLFCEGKGEEGRREERTPHRTQKHRGHRTLDTQTEERRKTDIDDRHEITSRVRLESSKN